ncbi:hypothetical protein HMPREF1544_10023 [Mucor circinelloides 1006PhL]|uniref:GmrSD restriction endonucleases N-terminal domain-containing protein n=1 Tax=Mucor circinelloides f. circinelloides (strain 1006PhL) TaxID=1220926 RepID=S2J506_MUCC1|nr:hypothetical protein HMPREF1544_10023 [Mucor circinelloides 1006PhL]
MLSVHRIKEMISKGEIQLDAPYQREIIWESKKMSELIDSIINNYYIPPLLFVVREIRGESVRIVIDGKQRLTSARRFLKNLLPYVDSSSGKPVEKYYIERLDQDADDEEERKLREKISKPEHFISREEFDTFNQFHFVCIEYLDITEDDEFEIFSRVQLGVAITSAEKLKATNSRVAEKCRLLADQYHEISTVLQRKGHAALFQLIAHLMLTIKNGTEMFASGKALQEFVQSNETPSRQLCKKTEEALDVIKNIATTDEYKSVMINPNMHVSSKNSVKAIEFILFGIYISLVQRKRLTKEYAKDFADLRKHLIDTREGRAYLSKEAFLEAMRWVNNRLEKENLVAARVMVHTVLEDDNDEYDELKEEDITIIPNPNSYTNHHVPVVTTPTVQKPPTKRRRDSRSGGGIAVAKRGGKMPTGVARQRAL